MVCKISKSATKYVKKFLENCFLSENSLKITKPETSKHRNLGNLPLPHTTEAQTSLLNQFTIVDSRRHHHQKLTSKHITSSSPFHFDIGVENSIRFTTTSFHPAQTELPNPHSSCMKSSWYQYFCSPALHFLRRSETRAADFSSPLSIYFK